MDLVVVVEKSKKFSVIPSSQTISFWKSHQNWSPNQVLQVVGSDLQAVGQMKANGWMVWCQSCYSTCMELLVDGDWQVAVNKWLLPFICLHVAFLQMDLMRWLLFVVHYLFLLWYLLVHVCHWCDGLTTNWLCCYSEAYFCNIICSVLCVSQGFFLEHVEEEDPLCAGSGA